jgi:predicted O-methyltransferase YrrM
MDRATISVRLYRYLRRSCFPSRLDKVLAVPGWTSEQQLRYLMTMAQQLPDQSYIAEIGVWQGRSALALADACRGTDKRVFAIDPWQDYNQGSVDISTRLKEWGVTSFEDVHNAFRHYRRKLKLEPWVVEIRSTSLDAARHWLHGPVGMVFIDGNHDYGSVTADLDAWFPLLRKGGLICGDDWNWESVRAAVTDFVSAHLQCHLEIPCNNTWAFFKTSDLPK